MKTVSTQIDARDGRGRASRRATARQLVTIRACVRSRAFPETRAREDEAFRDHSIRSARGFDRDASTTAWTMDDDDATARAVSTWTRDARVASKSRDARKTSRGGGTRED